MLSGGSGIAGIRTREARAAVVVRPDLAARGAWEALG